MRYPFRKFLFIISLLCLCTMNMGLQAQSKWRTNTNFNFGCNLFLTWSKAQKFPGIRAFAGLSFIGTYDEHFMLHYGPSVSIYSKTLGANLNPLVGDIQVDFTNTLSLGFGWGDSLRFFKNLRTIHNGDFYNLVTYQQNAFLLSTNYIVNNHKRNQVVGTITLSFEDFTLDYYNDGPPFNIIPMGDNFDRYWTGGGTIYVHNKNGFNAVELSFDQFTGYSPLLYELANILGINVPLYDHDPKKKQTPYDYNTSMYQLKIGLDKNVSVDLGIVGAMVTKKGKYFGIQDIIHINGHHSLHPNYDDLKYFVGGSYFNHQYIKF